MKARIILTALLVAFISMNVSAQRYPSRFIKDKVNTVEYYFTVGEGLATDTTKLSATSDYGVFYYGEEEDLVVTNLHVVLKSGDNPVGTDTLSVQICFSDTIGDTTPTKLNTADYVVEDTLTGVSDTSFDNATITTGQYVWLELGDITTGRKPTLVAVTLSATKED